MRPRPAVHDQDQRQARRLDTDRQRQEPVQRQPVAGREADRRARRQVGRVQVRERPEQQAALAGAVVVEPGQAGLAVVDERRDPPLPALVRRQRAQHPVGELRERGVHLGEVRVHHLDGGPVADEAGREDLTGGAVGEDGGRHARGGGAHDVQAVSLDGRDHGLLAGLPVDPDEPQVVGVLVDAHQQARPVGRHPLRLDSRRVLRPADPTQEALLPGLGVHRGELLGAVVGEVRVEGRPAVAVDQEVAPRLGLLEVHRRLAGGDLDPEEVEEHRPAVHRDEHVPGRRPDRLEADHA